jgi:hypothetical protein
MRRYSIKAFENQSEVEVCQVDHKPQDVAKAIAAKTKTITTTFGRKARVYRYSSIRIIDNETGRPL